MVAIVVLVVTVSVGALFYALTPRGLEDFPRL
jgi:hypothetical protein